MKASKLILTGTIAVLMLFSGLSQNAYAKHGPKPPHVHFKANKHAGVFGGNYMKPKKQKRPAGWYRSTLTGDMVYGKPKK